MLIKPQQTMTFPPKTFMPRISDTKLLLDVNTATQGVSTDGTHIYTTDNDNLYKYNMDGTLIDSLSIRDGIYYGEDFCIVEGLAYIPLTNYPTTPRHGKIQVVDIQTMTLVKTIDLAENVHPASLAYKDHKLWLTVTEDASIYCYNMEFELIKQYTFPIYGEQPGFGVLGAGYSGFEWIGNYVFGNKHGGTARQLDVAMYDQNNDVFIPVAGLDYASPGTDQGLVYDRWNHKIYWAARGHSSQVWESTINIPFVV